MANPNYPATNLETAVNLFIPTSNQIHDIVNGSATQEITVDSGTIPSVRKTLVDNLAFKAEVLPWQVGSNETDFRQLRSFGNQHYFAGSATGINPIPMGTSPLGDNNWRIAPTYFNVDSFINDIDSVLGGKVYPRQMDLKVGDIINTNYTHLRVSGKIYAMSQQVSGIVSSITTSTVVVGGITVNLLPTTDNETWTPYLNYSIGHEVVRNGQRYIARAASGPDNGGAIEPNTVSSQLIWDPVLPTIFTSNDISSKWILLSDITFADFFSLEVVGGSKLTLAKNQFSCDVRFSFYEFGVGFQPPTVTVNTKTLGDDNPTFHTVKVSNSRVQLWMKINTNDPFPVSVLVKNHPRTSGSAAKAGILSVVDVAPTSATLVPYDTGYQFASIPIGMEVAFDTPPPTNDPRFRFVKLTADDAYNGSLLNNKVISGTTPNLVVKMTINSTLSPINGQQVSMLNTMGAIHTPDLTSGVIIQDAIRNITGSIVPTFDALNSTYIPVWDTTGNDALTHASSGLVTVAVAQQSGTTSTFRTTGIKFDASRVVPTAERVKVFSESRVYYKRIY